MENNKNFSKFGSVLESEVLDEKDMNMLEAGAKCENGCKKACLQGGQNHYKKVEVTREDSRNNMPNQSC